MTLVGGFILDPFFERLKLELQYSPDLAKRFDFFEMMRLLLENGQPLTREALFDQARFLFCERGDDEARFHQIFNEVFEKTVVRALSKAAALAAGTGQERQAQKATVGTGAVSTDGGTTKASGEKSPADEDDEFPVEMPWSASTARRYVNFVPYIRQEKQVETAAPAAAAKQEARQFLFTNDYHPITFREMAQSWRYFRLHQPKGLSDEPDMPATVGKIASERVFTDFVFQKNYCNREDALLILADRNGSMTPFHTLVDQLVRTAKRDGGHHKAMDFYFQNYPLEHVYRTPWLTGAVHLQELLSQLSPQHTYVMFISDGGAARGNTNPGRIEASGIVKKGDGYVLKPKCFLRLLLNGVKDMVWLNPMPRNRWQGTSAEVISRTDGIKMHSIYDAEMLGFTNAVKDLLYEN